MTNKEIPLHVVFAEAWVKKGDKYLLAKRHSEDDQAAGKWAVPGGKIDLELEDNIVENSIKREVREEVGVEVENCQFLASSSFVRSSGHHVVALSFLVDYKSGEAKPLEDQEEVRWVTIEELEKLIDPKWIAAVLKVLKSRK